ncbi:hypothetical protein DVT68_19835 [Dyella solisilvae]|uniref:DUF3995 domain-containing protein n=1 Tax=Dyella solisilvae TaxID=1920168 RepID=A0A370K2B7_9GAMM|nr:hypothetical protein [Dyella solisilvae]RDI96806.1 hypothetical protein DVT68_19835 [Dyella solisilvae]
MSEKAIIIFFFVVLSFGVLHGLRSGSMVFLLQTYEMSEDPGFYWAGIVVAGASAVALLAALIFG